jgi:hypothetical protein
MAQSADILDFKNWSFLDPRPVIYYDPRVDDWFCFWNGIHMTAKSALMVTHRAVMGSFACDTMYKIQSQEFIKYCKVGIFHPSWSYVAEHNDSALNQYYIKTLTPHINQELADVTPLEAFMWFEKYLSWR